MTDASPAPQDEPRVRQPDGNGQGNSPEPQAIARTAEVLRPFIKDPAAAKQAALQVIQIAEVFSGPLPPPRYLEEYERISPGAASAIIDMATREQKQRHRTENLELWYPYLGLAAGFFAFGACIAGAVFLALAGSVWVPMALLGIPVCGVVSWFIKGRLNLQSPAKLPQPTAKTKTATGSPSRRR